MVDISCTSLGLRLRHGCRFQRLVSLFSHARKRLFHIYTLLYDLLIPERNYPASNVSKFNCLYSLKLTFCNFCWLKYCIVTTRALLVSDNRRLSLHESSCVTTLGANVRPLREKSLHPSFRIHREIEGCHSDTQSLYIAQCGVSEWGGGGACSF